MSEKTINNTANDLKYFKTLWNYGIWLIIIIIVGNYFFEIGTLFHYDGHFGIILHPIKSFKMLYFGWGYNQDSFIYSLQGLQTYFNALPVIYSKYGFFKATFALLTQFSPVWGFLPLQFLFKGLVDIEANKDASALGKFIGIIVIILCSVFISTSLTPKSPEEQISSNTYITKAINNIDEELNKIRDRENLGIDNPKYNKELLEYKRAKLDSYRYGGYKLSVPCEKYCDYLKEKEPYIEVNIYVDHSFGNTKETQACYEQYYISTSSLTQKLESALDAYHKHSISNEEYKKIRDVLLKKNKEIVGEIDNIVNLKTIPNNISCSAIKKETPIYEKIGVPQKCFNDWKAIIEAEGSMPDGAMPCSQDNNDKIIEYYKTHNNIFD